MAKNKGYGLAQDAMHASVTGMEKMGKGFAKKVKGKVSGPMSKMKKFTKLLTSAS